MTTGREVGWSRITLGILLTCSLALTGCGTASEGRADNAPERSVVEDRDPGWLSLPLSGLIVGVTEEAITQQLAEETEKTDADYETCMAEAGFPHVRAQSVTDGVAAGLKPRPYSMHDAERRGLNVARQLAELQDRQELDRANANNDTDIATAQAAMRKSASCQEESTDAFESFRSLLDSYRSEVLVDTALVQAHTSWVECMADQGFPAETVAGLSASILSIDERQSRSGMTDQAKAEFDHQLLEREIPAARAVVACDRQALFPVMDKWAILERRWMDEHASEIRELPESTRMTWGSYVDV